jgi:hypothetical protein
VLAVTLALMLTNKQLRYTSNQLILPFLKLFVDCLKQALITWKKERNERWFSSLRSGFKITYEVMGSVQLTFLRLLSKEAYQNFTYNCVNSIAWFSQSSRSYDFAVKFMGQNNHEFGFRSVNKPKVLFDGCKVLFLSLIYINFRLISNSFIKFSID